MVRADSHALRFTLLAVLMLLIGGAAVAVSVFLAAHTAMTDSHQWCTALEILTAKPIPPTAKQTYQLYEALLSLERDYRC